MKQYGAMKATKFTRKQINVIWAKAKNAELKVEKWFIAECYTLSEYYGYDDNRSVASSEGAILEILEAVFANDLEKAQELITRAADDWYASYSRKNKEKCDRTAFVG